MPSALVASMDESGNTGSDLLNKAQPVYVLASVRLSDSEAADLLASVGFPPNQEAHFTRSRRSARGRLQVIDVLEKLDEDAAFVNIVHKRYMVYAKVTDDLLDVALKDATGSSLYAQGAHRATANFLFFTMPPLLGERSTQQFLERFVAMCRTRRHVQVEQFFSTVRHLRKDAPEGLDALLDLLISVRDKVLDLVPTDYPLDPCVTTFVAHTREWGRNRSQLNEVNYDQTPVMEAQQKLLHRLCDQRRHPVTIGHGDRTLHLPLPVRRINFVPSDQHPAVQLADLVAGSIALWHRESLSRNRSDFGRKIEPRSRRFLYDVVWPDADAIGEPDIENFPRGYDPAQETARWLKPS